MKCFGLGGVVVGDEPSFDSEKKKKPKSEKR